MSKKKEEVLDTKVELPDDIGNKLPSLELKDLAFSVAKDEKTGKYHLVTIKYDFATKTVGDLEVAAQSNDEKVIVFEDYFKKAVSQHVWK